MSNTDEILNLKNNLNTLVQKAESAQSQYFSADTEPKPNQYNTGKSRIWILLLYPDNDYHREVHDKIFEKFIGIGALHDLDVTTDGELKKSHWHIVLYFPSAVYQSHILQEFPQLDSRFCQNRKDVRKQTRYLLHLDTPSKYQYPSSYLEGHIDKFYKYIDADTLESAQALSVIELIKDKAMFIQSGGYNLLNFVEDVCKNGLYASYRRNAYTFNMMISEIRSEAIRDKERNKQLKNL